MGTTEGNGLKGTVVVTQGRVRRKVRMQVALDLYVEMLPPSVVDLVGTDTDEWKQIVAAAHDLVQQHLLDEGGSIDFHTEATAIIERRRPGGRPRNLDRPDEKTLREAARERARASKDRRKAAGRKEVKYLVESSTFEAAQKLIMARGLKGMTQLFETLVSEATAAIQDDATLDRGGSP